MLAKPFAIKMGDKKQLDVESLMETEGQQPLLQQGPIGDVNGNTMTQADLDG